MKPWIALLPVMLLASCQTMTPQERRATDEQTCRDFGFRSKNDAFAECLQRLEMDRRAQRRANERAFAEFQNDNWRYRQPIIIHQPPPSKP